MGAIFTWPKSHQTNPPQRKVAPGMFIDPIWNLGLDVNGDLNFGPELWHLVALYDTAWPNR